MSYPNIKSDRSERVSYDKADFPAYIRKGKLSAYPNFSAESHWHDDIELIYIISGQMRYNVNGETVLLEEQDGIFINARQLHFGYSEEKCECEFICVLLHPILLCSSQTVERKYVSPLLFNDSIPFYHLKKDISWEKNILQSVREIYKIRKDSICELKIQREFFNIWIALCENAVSIQPEQISRNHSLSVLKDMISFINDNYAEKISLGDIASSGKVGKTGCCSVFKRYINKTPNEYLTELRLRKAAELMKDTDMTILEICYAVGFSGASYFAETFHRFFGCTPSEYRKQIRTIR